MMKQLAADIHNAFAEVDPVRAGEMRSALRASQVRAMWKDLVEEVIAQHTNGIYIVNESGKKILHVYVDESIYAAELNNRRELIVLLLQERFDEHVDEFQIHISYGMMKQRHPFAEETPSTENQNPAVPLDTEELAAVEEACMAIEDEGVRAQFKEAMIADLEWKKGNPQ